MSTVAYIGFGSNQGDRSRVYSDAVAALSTVAGVAITKRSRLYETDPVGIVDGGGLFLNGVIELETELSPRQLFQVLRSIELRLGKSPSHESDRSRIVDLDLLLFGSAQVNENDLMVPHPRMHQRGFVLIPLSEIAAAAVHPGLECTVENLVDRLPQGEILGVRVREEPEQ